MTDSNEVSPSSGEVASVAGPAARRDLAHAFVELADAIVGDFDLLEFLQLLAERCVQLLTADESGLVLADQRGHLRLLAATSEETRVLELFELQNAEGPCLDSYRSGEQVVNIAVSDARKRWPKFTPEAERAGYASVHAMPLRLRGTVIGSINLFCAEHTRLNEEDISIGQALADVATIGLLSQGAHQDSGVIAETLQEALNSRIIIEQAKGVLAASLDVDMQDALILVRHHAHSQGSKLSSVARAIVDGSLPAAEVHVSKVARMGTTP